MTHKYAHLDDDEFVRRVHLDLDDLVSTPLERELLDRLDASLATVADLLADALPCGPGDDDDDRETDLDDRENALDNRTAALDDREDALTARGKALAEALDSLEALEEALALLRRAVVLITPNTNPNPAATPQTPE